MNPKKAQSTDDFEASLQAINAQLKIIRKRLKVPNPLSAPGYLVKKKFEFVQRVKDILSSHKINLGDIALTSTLRSWFPYGRLAAGTKPESDFHARKRKNQTHESTTDPDGWLFRKSKDIEV